MFYFSDQFNQKGSISSSNVENSSILRDVGLVHPSQHSPHALLPKPADRNYLIITIVVNTMGGKDVKANKQTRITISHQHHQCL